MIDETLKMNGRLSNNELLCEHLGTVASEDVVMLSEAAPLCRCNVPCQLQGARALVTISAVLDANFHGVEWVTVKLLRDRAVSTCLFSDCLSDSPQWDPCPCAAKA